MAGGKERSSPAVYPLPLNQGGEDEGEGVVSVRAAEDLDFAVINKRGLSLTTVIGQRAVCGCL